MIALPTVTLLRSRFVLLRVSALVLVSLFAFLMAQSSVAQAQTSSASASENDDILFLSEQFGDWKAFIMDADGSNQRRITRGLNIPRSYVNEYAAVFSPDRTQILLAIFKRTIATGEMHARLYRVNADGKELKLLWRGPEIPAYVGPVPVWSPNGDQIVFESASDNGSALYVINSDGSGLKTLVAEEGQYNFDPVWSPDGTQILFASSGVEENVALLMINADGTGLYEVLPNHKSFAWGGDGQKIAVTLTEDGDLYFINPDGSGLKQVTKIGYVSDPAWSPDGAYIAFVSIQDNQENLYRINADGGELTSLTHEEDVDFDCLNWRPNGEQLDVIMSTNTIIAHDPLTNIYIIPADASGVITPLTDDSTIEALSHCFSLFG